MNPTIRKRVRNEIKRWLALFRPGDNVSSDDIVKRVHRYVSKSIDPGTIRRELRYMRSDGLINYRHFGQKRDKILKII